MIRLEITAEAVAWYGAIAATVSFLVSACHVWRDRARVRIHVNPGMCMYPEERGGEGKTYTVVTVSNPGRRPFTVTHVWFETDKKKDPRLLVPHSVKGGPREVNEAKAEVYAMEQTPALSIYACRYVCVSDATGKTHRRKLADALPQEKRKFLRKPTPEETAWLAGALRRPEEKPPNHG